jgi:DNA-binding response OmpR family regulator
MHSGGSVKVDKKKERGHKEAAMVDVLLINDDKVFLQTLAEGLRLSTKELHVITTDKAENAIEIMKTIVIDAVVTDLNMSGRMDGFDVLKRFQQTHPHVPVIILSANSPATVKDRLRGLWFAAYLEKPVSLPEIAQAILFHARERGDEQQVRKQQEREVAATNETRRVASLSHHTESYESISCRRNYGTGGGNAPLPDG